MLSMMVLNAIGHIDTSTESQKIVGIENMLFHTSGTGQHQFLMDLKLFTLGLRAPNFAHR